ncbi:MAG: PEP-CTERM sorting domain-containing protein, partial [Gluconacetobacter diazotrophicus]|nr:PEP-CTERM sorting domain-containing protein [Gluconacetobacter diazotrophicus]
NALGGSYVFSAASINQVVPEPRSVTASLLGAGALVVMRFRRRLRAC